MSVPKYTLVLKGSTCNHYAGTVPLRRLQFGTPTKKSVGRNVAPSEKLADFRLG